MKLINKILVFVCLFVLTQYALAGPLEGKAYIVDAWGTEIVPGGQDITGDLDVSSKSMILEPWGPFFGQLVFTNDIEILEPGTYTRPAGTVTVLAGQVGAYLEIEWSVSVIPVFMVWNVSNGGSIFTIADSDGDGVPGHAMTTGPFWGLTGYYEFTLNGVSEPYVKLTIDTNGVYHECTNGGSEVTMSAIPQLFGGAALESVAWVINGETLGEGLIKTVDLELGSYSVVATALTTTGQSNIATASVTVRDTTRPVVKVAFVDNKGIEVDSADPGKVEISIKATDTCDPDPQITSSTARPATLVSDGDTLSINASGGNLKLPVTAINVTATARDLSGNFSLTTSESSKTLVLE